MRIVAEIPHELFKVSIFVYNEKYIIKIELDSYEQVFKIKEAEVQGIAEVKKILNDQFFDEIFSNFLSMRNSLTIARNQAEK